MQAFPFAIRNVRNVRNASSAQAQWQNQGRSNQGLMVAPMVVLSTPIESRYETFARRHNYSMFTPQANAQNDCNHDYDEDGDEAQAQAGEVVVGRLKLVSLYAAPSKKSKVVARLRVAEEAVYTGEKVAGWYRLSTDSGDGWADSLLLRRR